MVPASTSSPASLTLDSIPTIEMSDLESSSRANGGPESTSQFLPSTSSAIVASSSTNHAILTQENKELPSADEGQSIDTPAAAVAASTTITAESEPQMNTDSITPGSVSATNSSDASGPICIITLLLTSGARHPYKLDEKYLIKRNVNVPGTTESGRKDPFSISVYTLKELILREWRDEWEVQPSSPSSIRLIHFGRLLDDKMPLKECRFNTDSPNVVHMTVKPQEVVDEEDASKGKAMGRDGVGSERTAGCRCTIM